jgi:transcriptional regulator with XRE-family HTH domain
MSVGGDVLKNLRQLRKEANISQQRLADEIGSGITQPQIQNYEKGNYEPDIDTIIKIADIFDTSVDYLIGRTTYKPTFEAVGETGLTDKEQSLVHRFRRYNEAKRHSLFLFMNTLDVADIE